MDRAESIIKAGAPDAQYGLRAESDLLRILASSAPPKRHRRALPRQRILLSVALVVVALAISTSVVWGPSLTATAVTAPLLEVRPLPGVASSMLDHLAALRSQSPASSSRSIRGHTWSLSTEIGDDGEVQATLTVPQIHEVLHHADGSVTVRVTAAEPFPGQSRHGLAEAGSLISEDTYAPGTFLTYLPGPPPTDPGLVDQWLARLSGLPDLTPGQTIHEISALLLTYPASPSQEAALVSHLAQLPDITVTGEVVDRLGRQGIMFSALDQESGQFEDRIIISPETGSIIATERLYVGSQLPHLPAPSVLSYQAWTR